MYCTLNQKNDRKSKENMWLVSKKSSNMQFWIRIRVNVSYFLTIWVLHVMDLFGEIIFCIIVSIWISEFWCFLYFYRQLNILMLLYIKYFLGSAEKKVSVFMYFHEKRIKTCLTYLSFRQPNSYLHF